MKNKLVGSILICVLLAIIGGMLRRQWLSTQGAIQSRETIRNPQNGQANHGSGHSSIINELQDMDKPDKPLTPPKWVETSSWNYSPHRTDFGLKKARPPQYVWIDWFGVDEAVSYQVYVAYSKEPFLRGKENYRLLATTAKSEFHSGDSQYLIGARHQYKKDGYYRFKVAAVASDQVNGPLSDYFELVLDHKAPLVTPGLSYNEKHSQPSTPPTLNTQRN